MSKLSSGSQWLSGAVLVSSWCKRAWMETGGLWNC